MHDALGRVEVQPFSTIISADPSNIIRVTGNHNVNKVFPKPIQPADRTYRRFYYYASFLPVKCQSRRSFARLPILFGIVRFTTDSFHRDRELVSQ